MSQSKRRTWTAAEKLRIVLLGMQANVDVAELCRREGISPGQLYVRFYSAAHIQAKEWATRGRLPRSGEARPLVAD